MFGVTCHLTTCFVQLSCTRQFKFKEQFKLQFKMQEIIQGAIQVAMDIVALDYFLTSE